MNFQSYVDTNLVGSGKVSQAAILGLGGGVWASSPGLQLSTEEQNAVISAFKDLLHTQASGLKLNERKYFCVQATPDRSIYLVKQADGAIIVKTKQAILVALYNSPIQRDEAAPTTEGLADYLISIGY